MMIMARHLCHPGAVLRRGREQQHNDLRRWPRHAMRAKAEAEGAHVTGTIYWHTMSGGRKRGRFAHHRHNLRALHSTVFSSLARGNLRGLSSTVGAGPTFFPLASASSISCSWCPGSRSVAPIPWSTTCAPPRESQANLSGRMLCVTF